VIRAFVIAIAGAAVYPVVSSLADSVAAWAEPEAIKLAVFPALTGAAAALAGRRREPLAAAAVAAALAMIIVDLTASAWYLLNTSLPPAIAPAERLEYHAARGIVAFFIGLGGGAVAALTRAAFARGEQAGGGRHRLAVVAAVLLVLLWACFGISKLPALHRSRPPEPIMPTSQAAREAIVAAEVGLPLKALCCEPGDVNGQERRTARNRQAE